MFQRIMTINGRKYIYNEERRREGKKVISKSTYVRPWDGFSLIGHILKNGIGSQSEAAPGQLAADKEVAKAEASAAAQTAPTAPVPEPSSSGGAAPTDAAQPSAPDPSAAEGSET